MFLDTIYLTKSTPKPTITIFIKHPGNLKMITKHHLGAQKGLRQSEHLRSRDNEQLQANRHFSAQLSSHPC